MVQWDSHVATQDDSPNIKGFKHTTLSLPTTKRHGDVSESVFLR